MSNVRSAGLPSAEMRWDKTVDQSRSRGYITDLVLMRRDPKVSENRIASTQDLFSVYCHSRTEGLGKELGLPEAKMGELRRKVDIAVERIMAETFNGAGGSPVTTKAFKEIVKSANAQAQRSLMELAKEFASPDLRPQIVPFKDANGTIRVTVIKPAPTIENLVLRGGGAKGIGNGAALVELEKAGVLANVKTIVGTSAGALTALALAAGMSAQEFKDFADKTDIAGLKGSPSNFKTLYPMIDTSRRAGFNAGFALQTMDEVSASQVRNRLEGSWGDVVKAHEGGTITDAQFARFETLKEPIDITDSRDGKMVTFGDLRAISKLFSDFKDLTLTGMNRTDSKLAYFSADTTPDMPVAVAGRISMSIPGFFASVTYDAGEGKKTWVDGGVGSNMPSGAVTDKLTAAVEDAKADLDMAKALGDEEFVQSATKRFDDATKQLGETRSRTLLMNFDEEGKAYKRMHQPSAQRSWRGPIDWIKGAIAGDTRLKFNEQQDKRNIYDAGPNVAVVHHGNIGTLNLSAGQRRKDAAALEAQMRMLQQVAVRQNQAVHDVFTSEAKAAESLSRLELDQIVTAGAPKLDDFQKAGRTPIDAQSLHRAALAVYDKAAELLARRG